MILGASTFARRHLGQDYADSADANFVRSSVGACAFLSRGPWAPGKPVAPTLRSKEPGSRESCLFRSLSRSRLLPSQLAASGRHGPTALRHLRNLRTKRPARLTRKRRGRHRQGRTACCRAAEPLAAKPNHCSGHDRDPPLHADRSVTAHAVAPVAELERAVPPPRSQRLDFDDQVGRAESGPGRSRHFRSTRR